MYKGNKIMRNISFSENILYGAGDLYISTTRKNYKNHLDYKFSKIIKRIFPVIRN